MARHDKFKEVVLHPACKRGNNCLANNPVRKKDCPENIAKKYLSASILNIGAFPVK